MHQETISILRARACKTIGRVLTVLVFSTAFLRPDLAIGRGFHGGGFHPGFHEFQGGAFQAGFHEAHTGAFEAGFHEFHAGAFHDGHFGEFHRFDHHGFRRGLVVVPAFGAWWGGGWGWPDYDYPEGWAADGAGPTTITQTAATTGPDPTPGIGITAPIRRATTPT